MGGIDRISLAAVGCVLALMPVVAFGELREDHSRQAAATVVFDHHVLESKPFLVAQSFQTGSAGEPDSSRTPLISASETNGSEEKEERRWFVRRLLDAYVDEFKGTAPVGKELPRRALPAPWDSPPFPSSEFQGSPLIGIPSNTKEYPLMRALYGSSFGDKLRASRVKGYGWVNGSYNWSTNDNSNMPTSYWIVPDSMVLQQAVFRIEREVDTVQTDHIDIGFRVTALYGADYRYMTSGGWLSEQLLKHNQRLGFDPTEIYIDTYVPWVAQGLTLRVGRWIATPDIEVQFAPDNYLGTHSILFTHDTYTQTGVMATVMLNQQWTVQGGVHAGTDMAPWYKGATPTGVLGVRWVALDNKDSVYLVLNAINTAKFSHFEEDGQPAGHDNFNYIVGTWQHKFTREIHTKTEGYYMWQEDAVVGGTPSIGPARSFGGGGGRGAILPGTSLAYGIVNYTVYQTSMKDFFTLRNEWWRDERGMRSGFAGNYSSHTLGWTHHFNDILTIRPEVGYYRNYDRTAFDLGTERDMVMIGLDTILRY